MKSRRRDHSDFSAEPDDRSGQFCSTELESFSVGFGAGISECSSRAAVAALTNRSLSCQLHASGVSNMRHSIERNTWEVMFDDIGGVAILE